MIIANTRLKKIPEKCTKCKFSHNVSYMDAFWQGQCYKRCSITGTEVPYVYNEEKRNWEYTKPKDCPLIEVPNKNK